MMTLWKSTNINILNNSYKYLENELYKQIS